MPASDPYGSLRDRARLPLRASFGAPDPRVPRDVRGLAFSASGDLALALDADGFVAVWELSAGAEVGALTQERSRRTRCASFAGETVVFLDDKGIVQRWDPRTDRQEELVPVGAPDGRQIAFTPDGRLLALVSEKTLALWDLKARKALRTWPDAGEIRHLSIAADGGALLGTTLDDRLAAFDPKKGTRREVEHRLEVLVAAVVIKPTLAAVASSTGVWLVDLAGKGKPTPLLRAGIASPPTSLALDAEADRLAAGFASGAIRVFDLAKKKAVLAVAHTSDVRTAIDERAPEADPFGAARKAEAVALSRGGLRMASGAGNTVRLWDVESKKELRFGAAHRERLVGVAVSGERVVTAGDDGLLATWDRGGKTLEHAWPQERRINALAVSGATAWLGLDGSIDAWDLASGGRGRSIPVVRKGARDRVESLATTPDGALLVSGSMYGFVEAWDGKSAKPRLQFKTPDAVGALAVGGPGWIAAGDAKGRFFVIELQSGRELAETPAHKEKITGIALSPDGKLVATSTPNELGLWEVQILGRGKFRVSAHRPIRRLEDHFAHRPVAFSQDGSALLVGGRLLLVVDVASGRDVDRFDLRPARDAIATLRVEGEAAWAGTARGVALEIGLQHLTEPAPRAVEVPAHKPAPKGPFAALAMAPGPALSEALLHHFAPWAATKPCHEILERLVERVRSSETDENGNLVLAFATDSKEAFTATFAQPFKGKAAPETVLPPKTYWDVVRLHNGVRFKAGAPEELDLFGYDEEEGVLCDFPVEDFKGNPRRHLGFCDAGPGWFFFDLKSRNKLGEPEILLAEPEVPLAKAKPFPMQDKVPFGVGGFVLRALAHRVFAGDKAFTKFGW